MIYNLTLPTSAFGFALNKTDDTYKISAKIVKTEIYKLLKSSIGTTSINEYYLSEDLKYTYSVKLNDTEIWQQTTQTLMNDNTDISLSEAEVSSALKDDTIVQSLTCDFKVHHTKFLFNLTSDTYTFLAIKQRPINGLQNKNNSNIGLVFKNLNSSIEASASANNWAVFNNAENRFIIPTKPATSYTIFQTRAGNRFDFEDTPQNRVSSRSATAAIRYVADAALTDRYYSESTTTTIYATVYSKYNFDRVTGATFSTRAEKYETQTWPENTKYVTYRYGPVSQGTVRLDVATRGTATFSGTRVTYTKESGHLTPRTENGYDVADGSLGSDMRISGSTFTFSPTKTYAISYSARYFNSWQNIGGVVSEEGFSWRGSRTTYKDIDVETGRFLVRYDIYIPICFDGGSYTEGSYSLHEGSDYILASKEWLCSPPDLRRVDEGSFRYEYYKNGESQKVIVDVIVNKEYRRDTVVDTYYVGNFTKNFNRYAYDKESATLRKPEIETKSWVKKYTPTIWSIGDDGSLSYRAGSSYINEKTERHTDYQS